MKLINILIGCMLIMSTTLVYAQREKGGTEDINIGIGELQQSSGNTPAISEQDPTKMPGAVRLGPGTAKPEGSKEIMNKEDEENTGMLVPAIQKPKRYGGTKSNKGGNVETEWKVEEGEK